MKYEWNKPFQLIMKIKKDYFDKFPDSDNMNFSEWIEELNNEEYSSFVEPLQISQHKDFIILRYGLAEMQRGMWEDENSIYRQCRSLVIDVRKEEIVVSPFRKFFNLNEVPENSIENISNLILNARQFEISDKLDGSMQSLRYYNGEYYMFGSKSLTPSNSWRLKEGLEMLTDSHRRMAFENKDFTFVFEYISLKDAHVVIYNKDQEGLYLIGIINTTNGHELPYFAIKQIAGIYDVKCAEIENKTFDEILELSKNMKSNEKEGWVLNIDGHKVKIKCDDYVKLHRVLDKVSSVNVVIKAVADNTFDDLISKIPESYKGRILSISDKILDYVRESNNYIEQMFSSAPKASKKDFMIWVDSKVKSEFKGYVRNMYFGKGYNVLKSRNGAYKNIKQILGETIDYSAIYSNEDK